MPGAIAGIFYAVGTTGYIVVSAIAEVVISYGLSRLSQALTGKAKQDRQGPVSRDVNVKGTTEYQQIVYGDVRVAGHILFMGCSGTDNEWLWYVIAVAAHQCDGIVEFQLDDRVIPDYQVNASNGLVSTPAFSDGVQRLNIWKHLGTHNQAADSNIEPNFVEWTTNHRGAGICYVVYRLDRSETAWPNGAPQSFLHRVRGKLVYDPRYDSTNGGSGSQRTNDATTWTFSNNPALCSRDYLTSGSKYFSTATPLRMLGVGESDARINDAYIIAAANTCDEHVLIPSPFSSVTTFGTGVQSGNVFYKSGGTSAWDSGAYSTDSIAKGSITGKIYIASGAQGFGLHTSAASAIAGVGPGMAYGFYFHGDSTAIQIVESGTPVLTISRAPTTADIARIDYDGTWIRYSLNDQLLRTVAVATANQALYFNVAIYSPTLGVAVGVERRYTCDTQLSCGDTHQENIKTLLSSMNGDISYAVGKYRFYAGAYITPAITLTDNDIVGDIEINTHPIGEDLYNYVTGVFFDEARNWQQSNFPAQTQLTYQSDDNGLATKAIELHATRGNYRAQRIAMQILEQGRNKITLNLAKLSPKAMQIARGETFYATISKYGYTAQPFKCLEWSFLPSGFISMLARIESAAAYSDPSISAYTDPVTNTPPYSQIEPPSTPTSLTTTSLPNNIKLQVGLSALVKGAIVEIWENTSSSPFSSATKIVEGAQTSFNLPKRDTTTRYYWARQRLNGQYSATYPASTGQAAAADLSQTTDIATGAITESYSHEAGAGTLATISFTPSQSGVVTLYAIVDGLASLDKDSGTYVMVFVDPASDYSGGPGASAQYAGGAGFQTTRCSVGASGSFSITGGVAYVVGIRLFQSFGTSTIYGSILQAEVKKR